MDVVLVRPEIAPNTGNIIRLCANTGARLHLVGPLGFDLDDRLLRRAGLDYHELAEVHVYDDFASLAPVLPGRRFGFSSAAMRRFDQPRFEIDDTFVFGAERAGLGREELASFDDDHMLRIPMFEGNRSMNLANAVAVVVFEAWRQLDYAGERQNGASTSETPATEPFDR